MEQGMKNLEHWLLPESGVLIPVIATGIFLQDFAKIYPSPRHALWRQRLLTPRTSNLSKQQLEYFSLMNNCMLFKTTINLKLCFAPKIWRLSGMPSSKQETPN